MENSHIANNYVLSKKEEAQIQAQLDRISDWANKRGVRLEVYRIKQEDGKIKVVISGPAVYPGSDTAWGGDIKKAFPDVTWSKNPFSDNEEHWMGSYAAFEIPIDR